jgi:hypothetical protein
MISRHVILAISVVVVCVALASGCQAPQRNTLSPDLATPTVQPVVTVSMPKITQQLLKPEDLATPSPQPVAYEPPAYGLQIHGCGYSPAEAIELVTRAGFSWVKQQVRWDEIEGVRGAYAWKCIDDVVDQARARGLKVLLSVTTAPRWARTWTAGEPGPPDADLFAAFLADMAKRYKGKVNAVEVFNEPNLSVEWGDNLNPGYYVQMLIAAYQAIKQVDSDIMVISAGLAPTRWNDWGAAIDDLEYMRLVGQSAAYYADCIGAHLNDSTSSPLETGSPFEQLVMSYRDLTGQSRPICLTEFGIATPVNGKTPKGFRWAARTTPEQQAQWLADGVRWVKSHPGIVRLLIVWNLNYYSDESDPNTLYALWTPNGMRPAYGALRAVLTRGRP